MRFSYGIAEILYLGVTFYKLVTYKKDRKIKDIERELALAIRKVKNSKVKDSLINIVKLESRDKLSLVRVYISTIKGISVAKRACEGLKSASGFIKSEISKNLRLKYMPDFIFIATDSIEHGDTVLKLLSNIMNKVKEQPVNQL